MRLHISKLVLLFAFFLQARPCIAATVPVDFEKDIRPIFQAHCYECHGEKKQKSSFRLDRKTNAFRGGDSGKLALVPGKPEESILLEKISSQDPDEVMPPKGERLSESQVALIRSWIQSGAAWPDDKDSESKVHWSYVKPHEPSLPGVPAGYKARNEIDEFVFARLAKEGLKPAAEAERATLIRRLALDLTGLPPTLNELDQFTKDGSEELWQEAVNYYLASPHYGEQRARVWLDLARYADSHGYEKDPGRIMWLYRDWVINAYNRNMPFDQFTIEQIAGDMLPNATVSQKIASGFHRNTMFNTEGGVDREEARWETLVDRVNTTATVWLGSTLACAQCHTHKYDPFTIKEYYQFLAYFNNSDEPEISAPSSSQESEQTKLKSKVKELEGLLNTQTPELNQAQAGWEYKFAEENPDFVPFEPTGFLSSGGAEMRKLEDSSLLLGGANPDNDTYEVVGNSKLRKITGVRLEVLPDDSLPQKSLGRHENGSFVLSQFQAVASPINQPGAGKPVVFKKAAADYTQNGHSAMNLIDGKAGPGWAISAGEEKMRVARYVLFELAEPIDLEGGATLKFELKNGSSYAKANLGRFRISLTTSEHVIPSELPPVSILNLLAVAPINRTEAQKAELAKYYRGIAPELASASEQFASARTALEKLEKAIPKAMVMVERKEPRETHMRIRGNFLTLGDAVSPALPAVFHYDQATNRLGLAQWLVSRENPLTARVTVNRIWSQIFGHGLVETEEDFGTQGSLPTHPELLDFLAMRFMGSGWDVKALYKLILSSAVYRESSHVTPELLEKDPANQLYARGPRFRVNAEAVRDVALASSGLLDQTIGGPSVFPYQPDGIWTQIYGDEKWVLSTGHNRYRRGLYTYWKRTSPYPAFMSFDAPSRELCTARRPRTNTPLQALTTLNDPAYVEAAQALARKIMSCDAGSLDKCLDFAFRTCLSRLPRTEERSRLKELFNTELEHYTKDRDAAEKMAFGEEKPAGSVDASKAAAWTVVANVLLNLDETITKS